MRVLMKVVRRMTAAALAAWSGIMASGARAAVRRASASRLALPRASLKVRAMSGSMASMGAT